MQLCAIHCPVFLPLVFVRLLSLRLKAFLPVFGVLGVGRDHHHLSHGGTSTRFRFDRAHQKIPEAAERSEGFAGLGVSTPSFGAGLYTCWLPR